MMGMPYFILESVRGQTQANIAKNSVLEKVVGSTCDLSGSLYDSQTGVLEHHAYKNPVSKGQKFARMPSYHFLFGQAGGPLPAKVPIIRNRSSKETSTFSYGQTTCFSGDSLDT